MDKFEQHLDRASEIVRGWPAWKQTLLGGKTTRCPGCGANTLEEKYGEYRFDPPSNIGTIVIADATWQECSRCGAAILSHVLDKAIDLEAIKRGT